MISQEILYEISSLDEFIGNFIKNFIGVGRGKFDIYIYIYKPSALWKKKNMNIGATIGQQI